MAGTKPLPHWQDDPSAPLTFIGVDAQYFSAVLMPQRENPADVWFDELLPIRVGKVDPQHTNLTNTSCRLIGKVQAAEAGRRAGEPLQAVRRPEEGVAAGQQRVSPRRADLFRLADLRSGSPCR